MEAKAIQSHVAENYPVSSFCRQILLTEDLIQMDPLPAVRSTASKNAVNVR